MTITVESEAERETLAFLVHWSPVDRFLRTHNIPVGQLQMLLCDPGARMLPLQRDMAATLQGLGYRYHVTSPAIAGAAADTSSATPACGDDL